MRAFVALRQRRTLKTLTRRTAALTTYGDAPAGCLLTAFRGALPSPAEAHMLRPLVAALAASIYSLPVTAPSLLHAAFQTYLRINLFGCGHGFEQSGMVLAGWFVLLVCGQIRQFRTSYPSANHIPSATPGAKRASRDLRLLLCCGVATAWRLPTLGRFRLADMFSLLRVPACPNISWTLVALPSA